LAKPKDDVRPPLDGIIQKPQEFHAGVGGAGPQAVLVSRHAIGEEYTPILRPFLAQARRRHDNHRASVLPIEKNRGSDRERYEGLAHADLVGEDDARLARQA
jgi:hypothetical protein